VVILEFVAFLNLRDISTHKSLVFKVEFYEKTKNSRDLSEAHFSEVEEPAFSLKHSLQQAAADSPSYAL